MNMKFRSLCVYNSLTLLLHMMELSIAKLARSRAKSYI